MTGHSKTKATAGAAGLEPQFENGVRFRLSVHLPGIIGDIRFGNCLGFRFCYVICGGTAAVSTQQSAKSKTKGNSNRSNNKSKSRTSQPQILADKRRWAHTHFSWTPLRGTPRHAGAGRISPADSRSASPRFHGTRAKRLKFSKIHRNQSSAFFAPLTLATGEGALSGGPDISIAARVLRVNEVLSE